MITIFAVPKAFKRHFAIIQENAIESWSNLNPKCEIILFGDDIGTDKISQKFKAVNIKNIEKNKEGTPILSDVFQKAQKIAKNSTIAYVNADIVLFDDFLDSIGEINFKKFLISGQRLDINTTPKINFKGNWEIKLRDKIKKEGLLNQVGALDYFIFPKNLNFNMPPFAVGRGAWDNWLIYKAKFLKIPIIDATQTITAIHQNHDYSHAGGYKRVWYGEERLENLRLARGKKRPFNLLNSDWLLTPLGLTWPPFSIFRTWRRLQSYPTANPGFGQLAWPLVIAIEFAIKIYQKLK